MWKKIVSHIWPRPCWLGLNCIFFTDIYKHRCSKNIREKINSLHFICHLANFSQQKTPFLICLGPKKCSSFSINCLNSFINLFIILLYYCAKHCPFLNVIESENLVFISARSLTQMLGMADQQLCATQDDVTHCWHDVILYNVHYYSKINTYHCENLVWQPGEYRRYLLSKNYCDIIKVLSISLT